MKGIEAAAAAGIVAGKAERKLEVISQVSAGEKQAMRAFLESVPVTVEAVDNWIIFDIIVSLHRGGDCVAVRISHYHTNIAYIRKNDQVLLDNTDQETPVGCDVENSGEQGLTDKSLLTVADIFDFASTCDLADIRGPLDTQIKCNTAISQEGLNGDYGANIGATMLKFYGGDVRNRAAAKAAAGSDARMSGCELPVVINSGSGNQGITASVPVVVYARELGVSQTSLYRALIVSNLITIHLKTGIGRLSAYCGAISAGCGAGSGVAYLYGGRQDRIAHTIVNALAINSGVICDGAKSSCAAKIASAVEAGLLGMQMAQHGSEFFGGDGIVIKGVENTIRNVGRLAREGMAQTDKKIIDIMLDPSGSQR